MALTASKSNMQDHYEEGYVSTKIAFLEDPDLQLPSNASDSYVGSLGRSNDTGSSMPSSAGSEPPEASPEQSRGREAGNRDAEGLYERQITPKVNIQDHWALGRSRLGPTAKHPTAIWLSTLWAG